MASTSDQAPASVEAAPPGPVLNETSEAAIHMNHKAAMKAHLDAQPKVPVKIHADGDVFVQANGYGYIIKPKVTVHVPQQIAEMLEAADYI